MKEKRCHNSLKLGAKMMPEKVKVGEVSGKLRYISNIIEIMTNPLTYIHNHAANMLTYSMANCQPKKVSIQ